MFLVPFQVIFADYIAQSSFNDSQKFIIFVTAEIFLCLVNTFLLQRCRYSIPANNMKNMDIKPVLFSS